jgi:hypothetical protein
MDYASDKSDRKRIIITIRLLGGGPVYWANKKQNFISIATIETEYIIMSFTTKTN